MLAGGPGDPPAQGHASSVTTASSLRELCHDIIEPTATIKWLVRAAEAGSDDDLRARLEAIAAAAGQIATICDDVLGPPRRHPLVRLDKVTAEAIVSAKARYAGVIDIVSQPVTASVSAGDIIRILCNLLANACRAAGPVGRIKVAVSESDGCARVTIADSGHGIAGAGGGGGAGSGTSGRAGLGLDIVGALALRNGGSVHLGASDLGGLAVTVQVPAQGGHSN